MLTIHGQLMKETYEEIRDGAVSEFQLELGFIKTTGGMLSAEEILVLLYQEFGDKPFIITVAPTDVAPIINSFANVVVAEKLAER